jgi:PAS domain S-box-containing protein
MLIIQDVTNRVLAERERQRAEDDLRFHSTVLSSFHEISSNMELSLKEKLNKLLKLGSDRLGLPIAMLSRIREENFYIQDSVSDHPAFQVGTTKKLDQTYCSAAIFSNEPLAFEHVGITEWREHQSYIDHKLESYIGVRVMIDGSLYGTLCFASTVPRQFLFRPADFEILKLMSQWVGNELQREFTGAYMRKLSSALEQTADAVIITDKDRSIEYVNPAFEKLTGYDREEVLGQMTYFLRSGEHDENFYEELWKSVSNTGVYRGILINRKKDGTIYHEQRTITPLKDNRGEVTHFIATGHDISDLVRAEEQDRQHKAEFAHVARLSTLGEMTSGLAHELNQPLCAITTYAQTCLRIIQSNEYNSDDVRYGLEQVVRQAELGGEIFRRLRNFARKEEKEQHPISLRDIIYEVGSFIRAECKQNQIQLIMEVSDQLPHAMADPIQIEQVLINLVRNSMDALYEVEAVERTIIIKASRYQRNLIQVCVSDSGRGCPKEVADRLFEPFFTTKKNGLGIGLGISQSIIVAHGGRLWLELNSENGSTFCFTLRTTKKQ